VPHTRTAVHANLLNPQRSYLAFEVHHILVIERERGDVAHGGAVMCPRREGKEIGQ